MLGTTKFLCVWLCGSFRCMQCGTVQWQSLYEKVWRNQRQWDLQRTVKIGYTIPVHRLYTNWVTSVTKLSHTFIKEWNCSLQK